MMAARAGMSRYAGWAGYALAMSAANERDTRTRAEEKVAHLLDEDEPTRALAAVMLKRSGMDQMRAESVLRKAGWWLS